MCKHCWDDDESVHHKDFIRGWSEPDFGEVDTTYKPKANKRKKAYPGCPGNENGPHVYVWTSEFQIEDLFYRYFGYFKREQRICCGCLKRNGSRLSERYMRVKENLWSRKSQKTTAFKYWYWEREDENYMAMRRNYIAKHGWNRLVYGSF